MKLISNIGALRQIVVLFTIFCGGLAYADSYMTVDKATDITERWTPEVCLYVQGDVGLGDDELESIGSWVYENYSHWTILLVANATSEEFTSDGEIYRGFDAVDMAAGTGLKNLASFKEKLNGTIFIISFDTRDMSYNPSELLKEHGLTAKKWENGLDSIAIDRLQHGRRVYAAVGDTITDIEARLERSIFWGKAKPYVVTILVGFLILGACFILIHIRRAKMTYALFLYDEWTTALDEKLLGLLNLSRRKREVLGTGPSRDFTGKTGELAEQFTMSLGRLLIMQTCANDVLAKAKALVKPNTLGARLVNRFFGRNYAKAIALLRDSRIEFARDSKLRFVVDGDDQNEEEPLWAPLEHFQPFDLTFGELIETFNQLAKQATQDLDQIDKANRHAVTDVADADDRVQGLITQFNALEKLSGGNVEYEVPAGLCNLVPFLHAGVNSAGRIALEDPIGATETITELESRIVAAETIVQNLATALTENLPALEKSFLALADTDISAEWIGQEFEEFIHYSNKFLSGLGQYSDMTIHVDCDDRLQKIMDRVEKATKLNAVRIDHAQLAEQELCRSISDTRVTIGSALSLEPHQILAEDGLNPDTQFSEIDALLTLAASSLSSGNLAHAKASLDEVTTKANQIREIVEETTRAYGDYSARVSSIQSQGTELHNCVPQYETLLRGMSQRFDPQCLKLGAGDPSHTRANDVVGDNLEEVGNTEGSRDEVLRSAEDLMHQGKILEAKENLDRAALANEFIQNRLLEIKEKSDRLKQVVGENTNTLQALGQLKTQLCSAAQDHGVTQSTIDAAAAIERDLGEARTAHENSKPNPFSVSHWLQMAATGLHELDQMIRSDMLEFADAVASLKRANHAVECLAREMDAACRDNVPESRAIRDAKKSLQFLTQELQILVAKVSDEPHSDWYAVDSRIDDVFVRAETHRSTLKAEVAAGQAALRAINDASQAVKTARTWTGSYGVSIWGSYGSNDLATARDQMSKGLYAEALRSANRAKQNAKSAVNDAVAKVNKKRREENRQREAVRVSKRRAELRRTSFRRISSGAGRSRISRPASGAGRSSRGRSRSGAGRSGW